MELDLQDKLIDAHVHLWTDDTEAYPFAPGTGLSDLWLPHCTPQDHAEVSQSFGRVRMNLVQITWYGLDHQYILDLIAKTPDQFVGTGIVPAYSDVGLPRPDHTMVALSQGGIYAFRVRGGGGKPGWLDHEGHERMFQAGANHNLALSFLMGLDDLPDLDRMCQRYPDTPVILDHFCAVGAKETIEDEQISALCNMARHRRVMVKVGPFHARGKRLRPFLDLLPLLQHVVEAFGPQRCMWESDTGGPIIPADPVTDYQAAVALIRDHADFLSDSDKLQILYKTAEDFFFNRQAIE